MRYFRRSSIVALVVSLLLSFASVLPAGAQSGSLTILFNADTRPQVPIAQFNPFPHEGIHMTCSLLGSESTTYLQLTVDGIMTSQENCDGTIEAHGLAGHSVDISAQDVLGVGPVFHLIVYGLDPSATPTFTPSPSITPTPSGLPFGCTTPGGIPFGHYAVFVASGHFTSIETSDPSSGFVFPLPDATNVAYVSAQWANINHGGLAGRYNSFDAPGGTLISSRDMYDAFFPGSRWVDTGTHITFSTVPGFVPSPIEADFCFWYYYPDAIPTPTPIAAATATPAVTNTPLPTPLPSYGSCVLINASLSDSIYSVNGTGDFFGRYWRIYSGILPVQLTTTTPLGGSAGGITTREWLALSEHTTSVRWSSVNSFVLQLCSVPAVPPTITATSNPFATLTATRTATATRTSTATRTATATATATGTATSTPTIPPTCLTPENEDSGECVIINQQQTQIALQLTQIAISNPPSPIIPALVDTPVPDISTAVAFICERDPCATGALLADAVGDIVIQLQQNADAPDCMVAFADLPDTTGAFALDMSGVGPPFCAVMDMTTYYREWSRNLSVFFSFLLAYSYYKATARRLGDV